MGNVTPQATVADLVSECNGTGAGPYTIFNQGGITSGQVFDKITEANAYLQQATGIGATTPTDAALKEMQKRFEVNYGAAKLAQTIMGIMTTDAFNYSVGGLNVSRFGAEFQTYTKFIDEHLAVAKDYIQKLHPWFIVYNSSYPTGYNEWGTPVTNWSTGNRTY